MIKIYGFRIYYGTEGWDLHMYGVGYKTMWFLGFSKNAMKGKP